MLTRPSSSRLTARRIASITVLAICALFALPAVGLVLFLRHRRAKRWDEKEYWWGVWAFAVLFGLVYGLILWLMHPLPFLFVAIWFAARGHHLVAAAEWIAVLWSYNGLLLSPALALVSEALDGKARPVGLLAPRRSLPKAKLARAEEQLLSEGFRKVGDDLYVGPPEECGGHGVVGRALGGDLWRWVMGGFFTLPLYALIYHGLVIGRSGAGKSELLRRIAYFAAKIYHMKVLWVDGKGDWKDAASFQLVMGEAGCQKIGVFPLVAHDGWRGSRQDILNLLMVTQIFESDYYRGVTLNMLKFAFYAPGLPVITSSQELLRRLYPPRLMEIYDGLWQSDYLAALSKEALWGPYGRYQAFFNGVLDRLDGEYGFGDWDAAYYLLDKKRLQQEIGAFARYLIEDFQLYLSLRQIKRKRQRILLVLDDFSAYSDMVSVVDLYERVRSAGGSVLVCAQGYEGLGPQAERILEGAGTTILHRCNLPEKLVRLAGKRKVSEVALSLTVGDDERPEREEVVGSTLRLVDEPAVNPDDVRELGSGEAYFLCDHQSQRVVVERVPLDGDRVEELAAELVEGYERVLGAYEQAQADVLMQPVAAASKSDECGESGKGKQKKRKQKAPPPQPPQPGQQAAASVIIHSAEVVIHSARSGQSTQPTPAATAQSGRGVPPAAAQPPASTEAKELQKEGSPTPASPPKRSLDDIE